MHVEETLPAGVPRGTIVAVPGLGESAGALGISAHLWAEDGWRVLAVDPRGHGQSPRWTPELLQHNPGDVIVRDLVNTLEATTLDPATRTIAFGHSAGGSSIAAVAAVRPDLFDAVVLEDPFWRLPVTHHQDPVVAADAAANLRRHQAMSDAERRAEISAIHPRWPADEIPEWSKARERMDVALVAHGDVIPSMPWPAILEELRRAEIPVQIITGTVKTGNTEAHRAIERSLGARVDVLEGATHFIRRDFRSAFHALIAGFLDNSMSATGRH